MAHVAGVRVGGDVRVLVRPDAVPALRADADVTHDLPAFANGLHAHGGRMEDTSDVVTIRPRVQPGDGLLGVEHGVEVTNRQPFRWVLADGPAQEQCELVELVTEVSRCQVDGCGCGDWPVMCMLAGVEYDAFRDDRVEDGGVYVQVVQ